MKRCCALILCAQASGHLGTERIACPCVALGSDKSPLLALPFIQGLLQSQLSANVFIMCCCCDRLGSESRLFNVLCFSSNTVFLEIVTLIKPGPASAWQGQLWPRSPPLFHHASPAGWQLQGSPAWCREEGGTRLLINVQFPLVLGLCVEEAPGHFGREGPNPRPELIDQDGGLQA